MLSKPPQSDLGQWRSDHNEFKNYLSHYKVILATEELTTTTAIFYLFYVKFQSTHNIPGLLISISELKNRGPITGVFQRGFVVVDFADFLN